MCWIKTQNGELIEMHGHLYIEKDMSNDSWLVKDKQDNIYYEASSREEAGRVIDNIFTFLKRDESLDLQEMSIKSKENESPSSGLPDNWHDEIEVIDPPVTSKKSFDDENDIKESSVHPFFNRNGEKQ